MSNIRNSVRLIGRVGNAPEIKVFDKGTKLATFSLATSDVYYNDKGEKQETTQWHNIVVWGKISDVVEKYVEKGKEIALEGKITYRNYDDKDGNKRYITEIVLNELLLL